MTKEAKKALKKLLGSKGYSDHPADREVFSYDASGSAYWPEAVVFPVNTEQVASIIRLANEHSFSVVPRGSGSGLTGGSLVLEGGVVLVLTRMNAILEIDPYDMIARVQPGVITAELQKQAEDIGLFYPPDPASRDFSTIGGNLAECAGGIRAVKYGVTRDYVLGLTAVIGDGRIVKAGTRTIKGVVGYDLARLLIGSEGTLGIITEATLKLLPKPPARGTLFGIFSNPLQASKAVGKVFRTGVLPVAMEFMDRIVLEVITDNLPFELTDNHQAALLAEVDGGKEVVINQTEIIAEVFRSLGGEVIEAATESEKEKLWDARRSISPAIREYKPLKIAEDIAVPRSKLPDLINRLGEISKQTGFTIATYGHAGDGNCHVNTLFDSEDQRPQAMKTVELVLKASLELGGTLSGEHGIGTTKAPYLNWELSAEEIDLMQSVKKIFDPNGVLNPGKIFNSGVKIG